MSTSKSHEFTSDEQTHLLQPNEGMYRPRRMMEIPDSETLAQNDHLSGRAPEKKKMEIKKLRELFNYQLRDMQQAEQKMAKSLPEMVKHSTRQELVKNLDAYLAQTKEQIKRLNMLAESIGVNSVKSEKEASSYLIEAGGNIVQGRPRKVQPAGSRVRPIRNRMKLK